MGGLFAVAAGCGKPAAGPAPTPPAEPVLPAGPEVAPAPRPVTAIDNALRAKAAAQCEFFEKQCKAFYVRHSRFPTDLAELVAPAPKLGKAMVDGGPQALADPWGKGMYMLETGGGGDTPAVCVVYCFEDGDPDRRIYSPTRTTSVK
jgi:hypothetical protein